MIVTRRGRFCGPASIIRAQHTQQVMSDRIRDIAEQHGFEEGSLTTGNRYKGTVTAHEMLVREFESGYRLGIDGSTLYTYRPVTGPYSAGDTGTMEEVADLSDGARQKIFRWAQRVRDRIRSESEREQDHRRARWARDVRDRTKRFITRTDGDTDAAERVMRIVNSTLDG